MSRSTATDVKFIRLPLLAFTKDVANFIVFAVSKET